MPLFTSCRNLNKVLNFSLSLVPYWGYYDNNTYLVVLLRELNDIIYRKNSLSNSGNDSINNSTDYCDNTIIPNLFPSSS